MTGSLPAASFADSSGMAIHAWGPPRAPVAMVFLHANGFSALTYSDLLAPLAKGRRIAAPDLRGHGATRLKTETRGRSDWSDLAQDVAQSLDSLAAPVVLAGHSMGATVAVLAAALRPDKVSRLALLDPVVMPPVVSRLMTLPLVGRATRRHPFVGAAMRRRRQFPSRMAALEAYRERGAFRGWPETTLRAFVDSALIQDGAGVRLACEPEWEASNYAAQSHDAWRALRRTRLPARALKAEAGTTFAAPTASLPNVQIEVLAGARHMFPMTHAGLTRNFLQEALEAI